MTCAGCDTPLPPSRGGRPRKWCSERCRKASYGQSCVDCGTRTSHGSEKARADVPLCVACVGARRTFWTRDAVIDAIQRWTARHGEPPTMIDWNPHEARKRGHPELATRFEADVWPWSTTVIERFGTWNQAIAAAGYHPRPAGRPPTVIDRMAA